MLIVVLVFGAVFSTVVAAFLGGLMLPPYQEITRVLRVQAAPGTVWALVSDPASYPQWCDRITDVEIAATSPLRWREFGDDGASDFEATTVAHLTQFVATQQHARHTPTERSYGLYLDGTGTRLEYRERLPLPNPLRRFVARYLLPAAEVVELQLTALAAALGESARPSAR